MSDFNYNYNSTTPGQPPVTPPVPPVAGQSGNAADHSAAQSSQANPLYETSERPRPVTAQQETGRTDTPSQTGTGTDIYLKADYPITDKTASSAGAPSSSGTGTPTSTAYSPYGTGGTSTTSYTSGAYTAPYASYPGNSAGLTKTPDIPSSPATADKTPAYPAPFGSYTTAGGRSKTKKEKKKKEKYRYSIGQLFLVALVSALACGVISSAIVSTQLPALIAPAGTSDTDTENTGDNNGSVKNINITGETDNAVAAVAEKAGPSVVGIRVTATVNDRFFGSSDAVGEGSGVIYSADGYIITNYHVISSAISSGTQGFGNNLNPARIEVFLPSDSETGIEAAIVGYDESADLAVLKIDKTGLQAAEIGDSDGLQVGGTAIAIGNPGGLEFMGSVSSGIISGLNRTLQTESGVEINLIQTDAAISPGNSGGALLDSHGKLIGINNSKMAGDAYEGMGFAIPVNEVVEITKRLIQNEGKPQSYLGLTIDSNYDAETLESMGFPAGVVVYSVTPGSPAGQAGIIANDIITKFNGVEVASHSQLNKEKNKYSVGDTVTLTIFRNNKTTDVQVTLGEMQTQLQQ